MNLVLRFAKLKPGEAVDEPDVACHEQPSEREKTLPEWQKPHISGARGQVAWRGPRTDPSSGSRIRTTSIPFNVAARAGATSVAE